jgi:hypothetical protein
MFEKRWAAVPPQLFTIDGASNGTIKIAADACTLFKVKQKIIINAATLPILDQIEIKKILDDNTIVIGPQSANIHTYTDLSAYTVALGAFIYANEQHRALIPFEEVTRAVYEEEPTVAERVILVDECGNKYNENNRFPVNADITVDTVEVDIDWPNNIKVSAIPVITANLQMTKTLVANSHAFAIKVRDGKSSLKMAFNAGDIALGSYFKINRGAVFHSGDMDLVTPYTLYFSSDESGVVVEVINWHF